MFFRDLKLYEWLIKFNPRPLLQLTISQLLHQCPRMLIRIRILFYISESARIFKIEKSDIRIQSDNPFFLNRYLNQNFSENCFRYLLFRIGYSHIRIRFSYSYFMNRPTALPFAHSLTFQFYFFSHYTSFSLNHDLQMSSSATKIVNPQQSLK